MELVVADLAEAHTVVGRQVDYALQEGAPHLEQCSLLLALADLFQHKLGVQPHQRVGFLESFHKILLPLPDLGLEVGEAEGDGDEGALHPAVSIVFPDHLQFDFAAAVELALRLAEHAHAHSRTAASAKFGVPQQSAFGGPNAEGLIGYQLAAGVGDEAAGVGDEAAGVGEEAVGGDVGDARLSNFRLDDIPVLFVPLGLDDDDGVLGLFGVCKELVNLGEGVVFLEGVEGRSGGFFLIVVVGGGLSFEVELFGDLLHEVAVFLEHHLEGEHHLGSHRRVAVVIAAS
jgi:hypothetical protein